jgi:hypothetical protein
MVGSVRNWASQLFEHSVWVSWQSSSRTTRLTTQHVQMAAELTRYLIEDTAVAALLYVNWPTSVESFLLADLFDPNLKREFNSIAEMDEEHRNVRV